MGIIANLKVTQYHGTGTAPGNYSGDSLLIDPADGNIIWDVAALRWEVTFDVAGFSGFYVSTGNLALPLVLLNFSGQNSGIQNLLQWTTAREMNSNYFELQRSDDGYNYSTISTVVAAGSGNSTQYLSLR